MMNLFGSTFAFLSQQFPLSIGNQSFADLRGHRHNHTLQALKACPNTA